MMRKVRKIYQDRIFLLLVLVIITSLVYILTLFPGVGGRINAGDSAKFQFIGKILGAPHSSGYPLYVLVNHLWIKLPIAQNIAWKVNLLSSFFGTLTIAFLFLTVTELIKNKLISFLGSLLLAFSPLFWTVATEAEVYTLNSFLLILVIFLAIRWYKTSLNKYLYLGILTYSFSFGNHLTMITILPALIYLLLIKNWKILYKPKFIGITLSSILLGASQYSYFYIRSRQANMLYSEGLPSNASISEILYYSSGRRFSDKLFAFDLGEILFQRIPRFLDILNEQVLFIGLILGIIGAYELFQKKRLISNFLLLAFLGETIYALNYRACGDLKVFFIPTLVIFSIYITYSLHHISKSKDPLAKYVIVLLVVLPFLYTFNVNYKRLKVDSSPHNYHAQVSMAPRKSYIINGIGHNYHIYLADLYYNYADVQANKKDIEFTRLKSPFFSLTKEDLIAGKLDRPFVTFREDIEKQLEKWGIDCSLSQQGPNSLIRFIRGLGKGKIFIVSIKDEGTKALNKRVIDTFKRQLGLKAKLKNKFRWSYAAIGVKGANYWTGQEVLKDRKVSLRVQQGEEIGKSDMSAPANIRVVSAGKNSGNISHIFINGVDFSINQRGMNIVILDPLSGKVQKVVNVDTYVNQQINPFLKCNAR